MLGKGRYRISGRSLALMHPYPTPLLFVFCWRLFALTTRSKRLEQANRENDSNTLRVDAKQISGNV